MILSISELIKLVNSTLTPDKHLNASRYKGDWVITDRLASVTIPDNRLTTVKELLRTYVEREEWEELWYSLTDLGNLS